MQSIQGSKQKLKDDNEKKKWRIDRLFKKQLLYKERH